MTVKRLMLVVAAAMLVAARFEAEPANGSLVEGQLQGIGDRKWETKS